jgi:hypothetical protein
VDKEFRDIFFQLHSISVLAATGNWGWFCLNLDFFNIFERDVKSVVFTLPLKLNLQLLRHHANIVPFIWILVVFLL